jgi:hypothetical protein
MDRAARQGDQWAATRFRVRGSDLTARGAMG